MSAVSGNAERKAALSMARESLRSVPVYDVERSVCDIELSDSTNQWGTPPAAQRAIERSAARANMYPTMYGSELKVAVAGYAGCTAAEVVTGNGSDDVIDSALGAFASPGDRLAYCAPTFVMIPVFAKLHELETVPLPFHSDWSLNVDALLAANARITYICSPNNPTGSPVDRAAIERVVHGSSGIVLIDEAYAEFSGESVMQDAPGWDRVLVVRTFSKAFGLAGLRAGYGVANASIIHDVEKARGPYTLNRMAEAAATAALTEGLPWVRERVDEALEVRARVDAALRELKLSPLSSAANFLCVPVPDARAWSHALRSQGIAVRPFRDVPGAGDVLRMAMAPWEQMERVLQVIEGLVNGGSGPP